MTYDTVAPALTTLEMFDTNGNGKIDQVKATFDTTLATYTAGTSPWTLANVPSGGTLASVGVSGSLATLTITEGGGAANSAVGSFTVALSTSATGVRDSSGNQSSFAAQGPTDKAGPVLVSATSGGGTAGLMQANDTLTMTFSEALDPSTVPASATVKEERSGGTDLTILGVIQTTVIANSYVNGNGSGGSSTGAITLTGGNTTISITLGTVTPISGGVSTGTGSVSFSPVATIKDPAGNAAVTSSSASVARLF